MNRTSRTSRLRLVVIQALVVALFATLLARLYYVQVVDGDAYTAAAASQSVREVVQQPARGLIVDAQGRPLVTNRMSWRISVDRTVLGSLEERDQRRVLRRVSRAVDVPVRRMRAALVDCGTEDAVEDRCWNGSPYQPVPVATGVKERVALSVLEQPEDYPAVVADQVNVRAYPRPYGVNLAHVLGYLSPITGEEYDRAEEDGDQSVNGTSVIGRAGVEKEYDAWLRGMPGHTSVAVDSRGRVLGEGEAVPAQAGDTLVTSIDAKVQGIAERQLHATITRARGTFDEVTGRNYEADSGAVVVMEAKTGRLVALASQPTYDPSVWVGGITQRQLKRLYSEQAGMPLLSRATQGQFAPGSTWKPFMTAGALSNGYSTDTQLNCSSDFQVGNRAFHNYESAAYGNISFAQALQVSCNTFFYRVGYDFWARYGTDVDDVKAKDPLVTTAKRFGFGERTGVDLPEEATGRIADRKWKRSYYESQKDYYCKLAEDEGSDFLHRFAEEFCIEGYAYRAGDAVNFAIGQGDTLVTPLQLTRAYAALSNGGTLYEPRIGRAVVSGDGTVLRKIKPAKVGRVKVDKGAIDYIDEALQGTTRTGTLAWKFTDFPLDDVHVRGKTGSAEVYGKQSTSWVASYDENYVVVMMVSQGGTGSGTSGDAVRSIWEALYGVQDGAENDERAAIPGVTPPESLPTFTKDGAIMPPGRKDEDR
ncbi:penicillin-binding protein 2 [Nocardioides insulae]|uniref:penicillin-binding protein 2 n=1 Tax=Nocardioides insulae TaxID=394734 RepID=UPI0003F5DD9C|nr:penicillin-binding protein 2 [Nocardioides insulae]